MATRTDLQLPALLTQAQVVLFYKDALKAISKSDVKDIYLDASSVEQADGTGIAFLGYLRAFARRHEKNCHILSLAAHHQRQLDLYEAAQATHSEESKTKDKSNCIVRIGSAICQILDQLCRIIAYVGELIYDLATLYAGHFRWRECKEAFYRAGVQAVPVVMLIGFLLGLILAFQSAMPLKMFGAEGFVGGLVGIALVRELGLIITAILMAGRSGSAFAAELGTMKVNEEIDALSTMGLRPVRFLALPRVLAGTLALPLLSLFASFAGLIGGWVVMHILGFSTTYYLDQLTAFVSFGDLVGSLCKAIVFGFTVSAVGCRCGLQAGSDAGAVGTATTSAVVTSIILVAALEGIFSVLFYAMGW